MRAAIGLAAAALLVAACGGTGGAKTTTGPAAKQYVSQVNAAERSLVSSVQRIAPGATPPVWARSVRSMQAVVARLGADLASILPPGAVAGAHRRLVATVRQLAAKLGAAARRASTAAGLASARVQLLRAFSAASTAFTTTIGQINAALRR
jgi:hypothetical protein